MSTARNPSPQDPATVRGAEDFPEALMAEARRDPARFGTARDLAEAAGMDLADLERLFLLHAHRDVARFLMEARVRAAGRLLLGGAGPVWAAGAACGFPDPATFAAQFLAGAGISPAGYQALGQSQGATGFTLGLPQGYRAADILAYHGRDPLSLSERVEGETLFKAMTVAGRRLVLELAFRPGTVDCRVLADPGPPPPMDQVHGRVVRMLGLGLDPAPFEQFVRERSLQPLVAPRLGLRIPLTADVWESLVWAILGQQVNLAFAYALRRRLTELCARATGPALAGMALCAHPTPAAVAALDPADLKPLQFSRSKSEYVIDLARAVAAGTLPLEQLPEGSATSAALRLSAERGVGPWTTHYVMMRGCGFGDCVPLGDAGLTLALQRHFGLDHRPTVKETAAFMAPFAPHRSLATFHLWASLKGVPA
jgi:AraC family transcriptional regulator of adaptative response / DNA-3-methyladenine glycosylase II